MSDAQADLAFMRGYALTCGYLRGRFQVPKIGLPGVHVVKDRLGHASVSEVRRLPDPPSAEALAFIGSDIEPDAFAAVISMLCGYSIGYLRWEPRNPSRLHAAIPRPGGGAFCSRLMLSVPEPSGRRSYWSFEPESHSLHYRGDAPCEDTRVHLDITCDLGRIVSGYGDFALTLALLEGGHCRSQLQMLLRATGIDHAWRDGPVTMAGQDIRAQISIGRFEFMVMDAARVLGALPSVTAKVDTPAPFDNAANRFPVMVRAAEALARSAPAPAPFSPSPPPSPASIARLLRASRTRTSGLQGEGFVPRPSVDAERLQSALTEWKTLSADIGMQGDARVRTYLAITGVKGMVPHLAEYDPAADELLAVASTPSISEILRPNVGLGAGYNFDEFAFVLLMTCPVLTRIAQDGAAGYRSALVEAGARAQSFLIAISSYGMFGRPFRAYTGAALEQQFGIDDQIVYIILCGADRIANPAYAMIA